MRHVRGGILIIPISRDRACGRVAGTTVRAYVWYVNACVFVVDCREPLCVRSIPLFFLIPNFPLQPLAFWLAFFHLLPWRVGGWVDSARVYPCSSGPVRAGVVWKILLGLERKREEVALRRGTAR